MAENTTTDADTSTEDTSGLKNKNADLVKRLKAAEKRAEDAEAAAQQALDDADMAKGNEVAKLQREITRLTNELQSANEQATASSKTLRDYKLTNALNEAMSANNVDDAHRSLLSKALRGDVEFNDDGEPTIGGKSVADYSKAFFAKEGKSYVRMPDHAGSGATGSTTASNTTRMTKENFNYSEFARIALDNPAEANAIADAVGRPELKVSL
jgi:hypothetical protein